MDLKKIANKLLFPPIALMLLLTPPAIVFLVCSMVFVGSESAIAIVSYVLSAYLLTVWCFRIPRIIRFFKAFKSNNKFLVRWFNDTRLRVNVSLYISLFVNTVFAVFQLCLGFVHGSFWFYSLAGYYLSLAGMRLFLVSHTRSYNAGENMTKELKKYRACGWVFLALNLILSVIVIFMIRFDRTFVHHEITTITIAAYTFTAFTLAIINAIKYRKYDSPAYSASKAISLAAACVSILTLETTMLTTFGGETTTPAIRRVFLATSGGVISVFLVIMAIYIITKTNKKLKSLKQKESSNGE